MDYFKSLLDLLNIEKTEDRRQYEQLTSSLSVPERRANGMTWYPIAIKGTELDRADYLTVEVERTSHQDVIHQFRFGASAALFSNHDPRNDRVEGTVSYLSGDRLSITLRTDELPEWSRNGKLGIDLVFDEISYGEMEKALKLAPVIAEKKEEGKLIRILTGAMKPSFNDQVSVTIPTLNAKQQDAVSKIMAANELAVVHGPPGTGKTTTIVQAIKMMVNRESMQVLVVAPSNAAVDLLSEKLSDEALNVVRVGNPTRVSERQIEITLDYKMRAHPSMKEVRRLKKQATEYREMARKYKRNFGQDERDQRKALYAEARNITKEVERTEQYITDDILSKAQVITATLVGANHYTVKHLKYHTVFIDEAGQALEPACWIPILKAQKIVMAGDHHQLPPTIKSVVAARAGLSATLMEKMAKANPEAVVLLEEQYRMHETIMGYSSAMFYGNRLQAHPSIAQRLIFPGDQPLLFIDTAGCGFEEKQDGAGISNPEEAAFLMKHLRSLVQQLNAYGAPVKSIAVVSPYRHQVEVLKDLVIAYDLAGVEGLAVNTIDSFQGQERDVVYISMTRSNTENLIGFLTDTRRMNVAMTRARSKLVVIGDSATLSQLSFYADFIHYAQERNGYLSAWEFMTD